MSSTAASLVRRINQYLGGGNAPWNGSAKRLAIEYTEMVDQLSQRFNLAQLQLDLDDTEEARSALHQPEPLLVAIRSLQFPRRMEWEKLVRTHMGAFRKLVTLDEVVRLEKLLATRGTPGSENRVGGLPLGKADGTTKIPQNAARQLVTEAGFAGHKSPAWIRMIPLVGSILAVGLALVLLAALGPGFFGKNNSDQDEGLSPEDLADLKNQPRARGNPGEAAFAPGKKVGEKEIPDPRDQEFNKPVGKNTNDEKKTVEGEKNKEDGNNLPGNNKAANPPNPIEKEKFGPDLGKGRGKPVDQVVAPGMIRSPEIAQLDQLITQNTHGDAGLKLRNWLQLDKDMANRIAVDGLLMFIRSDIGLLGRKPPPEIRDLSLWISSGRSLNEISRDLFNTEKLKSLTQSGKQGDFDRVEWFTAVMHSDMKALQFFSDNPRIVHAEGLFNFAANIDLVDEFTKYIDRKIIEYDGDRPKRINPYVAVILKEKRDLKNRSNEDLLVEILAINTELKRRIRSARYPWKAEPK